MKPNLNYTDYTEYTEYTFCYIYIYMNLYMNLNVTGLFANKPLVSFL